MTIQASLKAMLADGWTRCEKKLVPITGWPTVSRVVLERGDDVLFYIFRVYTDDSDWPGDNCSIKWTAARLVPVTLFEVTALPDEERAP